MQPTNFPRRRFLRNTSMAATGFFILPPNGFLDLAGSAVAHVATNATQRENAKEGTTNWQLTNPSMNREVEGYASLTSVNRGSQISFFISVDQAQQVNIEIYRMGWYAGKGGRLLKQTNITAINQPTPTADADGLIECNWINPYALNIPNNRTDASDWASGVYLAKLTASISSKQSYIIFVVRHDERHSDFLYQASFSTYQAYNNWPYVRDCAATCPGSRSLYPHNSDLNVPAYKVSFNRPFAVGPAIGSEFGVGAGEFITPLLPAGRDENSCAWEYNMVRWLEMKGYDLTYATNLDTHEKSDLLLSGRTKKHKGFFSVGHDEYWSWQMRDRVEQARDRGVSLGFFSSNVSYWQVRFESSPKTGQANRTMVCYKHDALQKDPYALDGNASNKRLITTLWRNSPVNRPEASMVGVMYWGNSYWVDMVITNPGHWMCSGTNLAMGEQLTGLVGYEIDGVTSSSPANIDVLARSPVVDTSYADTATYVASSGAVVFAAASNQWSWGLDNFNAYDAGGPVEKRPPVANAKLQQMMSNLLARMLGDRFPVARPGGPYKGTVGAPVTFDGRRSSDADGTIVSYAWTFSDGGTATGTMPTHAFASTGTFEVNLVVIDDKGAAHSSSTSVSISAGGDVLNAPSGLKAQARSGNSGHVLLTWVDNSNNEQVFRIERSLKPTTGFVEIGQVKAKVTSYTDKDTRKGVLYYYRVRASNRSIFSAYSNTASVATSGKKNSHRQANDTAHGERNSEVSAETMTLNVRVLPNPSYGAFNVHIQASANDKIALRVVDSQGRVVEQLQSIQPSQVVRIGENYRPGIYFVEVRQGAEKTQLKLVKAAY